MANSSGVSLPLFFRIASGTTILPTSCRAAPMRTTSISRRGRASWLATRPGGSAPRGQGAPGSGGPVSLASGRGRGGVALGRVPPAGHALAVRSAVGVEPHEVVHVEAVHRVRPLAARRAGYDEGADPGAGPLRPT